MSEFLSNFHFIRPFVLLLLLLPLGFFWHYARSRGRNSSIKICLIFSWLRAVRFSAG